MAGNGFIGADRRRGCRGMMVDPIGTLIGWGASFLLEHFEPLKGWLDDLAGNGDAVRLTQSWLACAAAVAQQRADELESRTGARGRNSGTDREHLSIAVRLNGPGAPFGRSGVGGGCDRVFYSVRELSARSTTSSAMFSR